MTQQKNGKSILVTIPAALIGQMDDDHVKKRVVLVFYKEGNLAGKTFRKLDTQQCAFFYTATLGVRIRITFFFQLEVAIDIFYGSVGIENDDPAMKVLVGGLVHDLHLVVGLFGALHLEGHYLLLGKDGHRREQKQCGQENSLHILIC